MSPTTIAGFTPFLITYPSNSTHYIYARAHEGSKKAGAAQQWPPGRTLFLVNVPPDATERELTSLFKPAGTVERVVFDSDAPIAEDDVESDSDVDSDSGSNEEKNEGEPVEQEQPRKRRRTNKPKPPQPPTVVPLPHQSLRKLRRTGQSAHVVFLDSSSLHRALVTLSKPRSWPINSEEPVGLSHYLSAHDALRPPLDTVRAYADSSIELYEFDLAKTRQKARYRKGEAIVDEDGFTLVTRGGAYGQTVGGGVSVATKKFQQTGETSSNGRKRRKGPQEKKEFYAFQKADKQRSALMKLKRDWEDTKSQVEKLRATRKFKPY